MKPQDFLIDRLESARRWTRSLIADVSTDRWYEMPAPGVGHLVWQLGHLAVSQVALIHMRCFDRPFDAVLTLQHRDAFGRGSTPVPDASRYPSIEKVRELFDQMQHESIELIRTISEAELDQPAGTEPHPHFATKAGAINTAAVHEGFHADQIAVMRRLWGHAPLR